jgi:hypothetical protein
MIDVYEIPFAKLNRIAGVPPTLSAQREYELESVSAAEYCSIQG